MEKHFTLPYEGGLIETDLPAGILHNYEKIWTDIYPESRQASIAVADLVVDAIKSCEGRLFRLGLTTGATPVTLYEELARRCRAGDVSFQQVEIFSIDEYYPASENDLQSRNHRLHTALLDQVDILPENIHIPDGTVPQKDVSDYCAAFDRQARNLDLLVIGIGEEGQVGFNEAGSNEKTRTSSLCRCAVGHLDRSHAVYVRVGDITVLIQEHVCGRRHAGIPAVRRIVSPYAYAVDGCVHRVSAVRLPVEGYDGLGIKDGRSQQGEGPCKSEFLHFNVLKVGVQYSKDSDFLHLHENSYIYICTDREQSNNP